MVIGAALRLPWLASRPLWLDEALQHHISSAPSFAALLARSAAEDLHPPGYSALGWLALSLGDADVWLRLPAWGAGVAAIVAARAAVRAWTDDRAGLVAAALVAVSPPCVAWSREARPYSWAVLAIFVLLWAAAEARRGRSGPLVAAGLAALPWHYGAWLVLGGVLAACAADPRSRRAALRAGAASAAGAALLAPHALAQWAARGDVAHLARHTGVGALPGLPWLLGWLATGSSAPASLAVGLALLPLFAVRPNGRGAVILAAVLAVGGAAVAGWYPLGPVRHGLVLLPALVLAVAPRLSTAGCALGCAAMLLCTGLRGPGVPVHDVPALLAALEPRRGAEPVWIDPMLSWPVLRYGLPEGAVVGRWGERWPDRGWVLTVGDAPAALEVEGARGVWVGPGEAPAGRAARGLQDPIP